MRSPESVGVCGASRYVDSRLAMPPCWYMHTRAHLERAALNHFQPLPFLSVSVVSPTLDVTPPPLVSVSFYLFLPALSTHPLFIRAPPVHVHARAHTPSLTLSATTSVLHSKALTSETSASTSKDGFIGYSFPPRARDAAGQTENFNRDRREV